MNFVSVVIAAIAYTASSAFAQSLLLTCNVKAKFDAAPIEGATITVKVESLKNYLYIDIDGPEDYQGGYSSSSVDTNVMKLEGMNVSDDNSFALVVKQTMKASGNFYDTSVKINRATGMFYLLQYSAIKGRTFSKDVSGECKKISSANKF